VGDVYLRDWIRLLEAVERLDFEYVIGGHGGVIRGKRFLMSENAVCTIFWI
jgi:hypothetical protein